MTTSSSIRSIETLSCDAGWRNYHFVKVTTKDGLVGWSEYDEGFGAPGVTAGYRAPAARIVGKNALQHERDLCRAVFSRRGHVGGVVALALGAIENALLDVKAKALGVSCHELLGGKIRDRCKITVALRDLAHQSPRLVQASDHRSSTASRRSAARCARNASPR